MRKARENVIERWLVAAQQRNTPSEPQDKARLAYAESALADAVLAVVGRERE